MFFDTFPYFWGSFRKAFGRVWLVGFVMLLPLLSSADVDFCSLLAACSYLAGFCFLWCVHGKWEGGVVLMDGCLFAYVLPCGGSYIPL